ncbi:MAG: PD40 domain-containing protein [Anaerolineales bacterium]|nr:PD40 domain-containing protein [Anaerolineales bacterium]
MKRFLILSLLILTACSSNTTSTPASFFDLTPASVNLGLDSTSEQIQRAMWESAVHWRTLQMDGVVTWFTDGTPVQALHEQVWIDPLNSRYKVEWTGVLNSPDHFLKLSDGSTVHHINLNSGQAETFAYPDFARVGQYVPPMVEGQAYPNPMWGQIGTPLSQLAFPSDYSQNKGSFTALGMDTIAGRETLIVEWRYSESSQPSWKIWLDTQTAVMLKLQEFAKDGSGALQGERVVNSVSYDSIFEDVLFAAPENLPQTGADPQVGSVPVVTESGQQSEEEAGELYFFLQPRKAAESIRLAKVSGVCVYDPANCPAMEIVNVPFAFNFTINAMSWSPDGKFAAFSYSDHANGTPTKLWLFDPSSKVWAPIVEFPFIDPPFWSPDGLWIAFRTQDGLGGEDVYVVHRDGSELKRVSSDLPADGRPYIMDGWYTENILMRSALPGHEGSIYLVRASDGTARPMFDTLLTKASFVASPDASLLAYDDYDYTSQKHILKVMEPDGANALPIADFTGGSIYPVVWSPNSNLIAFNYYGGLSAGETKAEVYVVGRDGTNLSLVYTGTTVGRLIFSPNGRYLLVEETTSATGGHLFLIDLATLEKRMLQAPGLSTDYDWYAPSWRP